MQTVCEMRGSQKKGPGHYAPVRVVLTLAGYSVCSYCSRAGCCSGIWTSLTACYSVTQAVRFSTRLITFVRAASVIRGIDWP